MNYAAILAGGLGSRLHSGGATPKQFLPVAGKPLLCRTLEPFLRFDAIDAIVVAVTRGWERYSEDLLAQYFPAADITVISGGDDRLGSLANVCDHLLANGAAADDLLLSHDAARPFVTAAMLRGSIDAMTEHDCATVATPTIDTVLLSDDGATVAAIPDRATTFAVQTPQTFRLGEVRAVIDTLTPAERETLTDGAKMYLLRGKDVAIVAGDSGNFKVTEEKDLLLADLLCRRR